MANFANDPTWEADVYQLATTDRAKGGADGALNTPLEQLANRTAYLKEKYDNGKVFNVKDYGAKGDNATNDAAAIQAAVNAAQVSGGTVEFPSGIYLVNTQITLSSVPISIKGSSFTDTVIKANSAMTCVFGFSDVSPNSRFGFKDFGITGSSLAQYGIKSATINHALFYRVRVISTTTAAFSVGYGWDNDIVECEIFGNTGDGIELTVNNNNAVNILNTKIFLNVGWGIKFNAGFSVNIQGCTIEGNRKGGIYVVLGMVAGRIVGNYFENNAQNGFTFTTPALTVKADIVLNGSSNPANMSSAYPSEGVEISGNFFSHAYAEEAVRIIGVNGLTISNNARHAGSAVSADLSAIYCDSTYSQARFVDFKGNRNWIAQECAAENIISSRPMYFSTWKSDQVNSQNYITDDFNKYALVSAGGGTIARSSIKYNGFDVFELTGAVSTDSWGVTLDVADYPELAGKPVYMASFTKTSATDSASVVYVNGLPNTTTANSTTNWRLVEMQVVMPSSGSVTFRFRKLNGSSGTVAYFTKPVIAAVGAPFREFYQRAVSPAWVRAAAPTTGTWATGDVVLNVTPAANAPTNWVCTTAGTPGTWKVGSYVDGLTQSVVASTGTVLVTSSQVNVNYAGACALTLPASTYTGPGVTIKDISGACSPANKISFVLGSGTTLEAAHELTTPFASITWYLDGTVWRAK